MKIRILGCSGGIGGPCFRTTSIMVNDDTLIDAGTGVGDCSLDELARIRRVFLTHSHLDHIAFLPLLIDALCGSHKEPITVYALAETIACLKAHIFNWRIWPDFTEIPNKESPCLKFEPITLGTPFFLDNGTITPLPAVHTVPAVGYQLDSGSNSLVFTGDTTINEILWPVVNDIKNLRYLLIEVAFPDSEQSLAELSRHMSPRMLEKELRKLNQPDVQIYITHLKPGKNQRTMDEVNALLKNHKPEMLKNNQVFEF